MTHCTSISPPICPPSSRSLPSTPSPGGPLVISQSVLILVPTVELLSRKCDFYDERKSSRGIPLSERFEVETKATAASGEEASISPMEEKTTIAAQEANSSAAVGAKKIHKSIKLKQIVRNKDIASDSQETNGCKETDFQGNSSCQDVPTTHNGSRH
ncbi:hypothetical protein J6590_102972 [Homalodisca vitripennis]|nr:hypothetical protein J6590_102972 [Homalodisca vitripennis]